MLTRPGSRLFAAALSASVLCAPGFAQAASQHSVGLLAAPSTLAPHFPTASINAPRQADTQSPADLNAARQQPHWRFEVAPLLWLASIEGQGGDGSAPSVDIGQDWSPFGSINGGFMLAFEARAPDERFSLLADGLVLSLADDEGALRTDTDALMFEFGAGLPLDAAKNWEAIAGLRYVDLEFGTELAGFSTNARQTWIDPWIGVRGDVELGGRWGMGMRADVGGFGVGTQFSWQALAALQAHLGKSVRFDIGYRAIGLDFDDDELEYDALIHGPQVALAFLF